VRIVSLTRRPLRNQAISPLFAFCSLRTGHFERFYEKVIKVKADVAAFRYLFLHRSPEGVGAVKGVAVRKRSSRPLTALHSVIIDRRTKRNAVQLSFVR